MNLENMKVQELNFNDQLEIIGGGGLLDTIKDVVVTYLVETFIETAIDVAVDHMNNGAGYGGSMDTLGKL